MWSFILLLLIVVIEGLAKLNIKKGEMEIEEYVSLEEELVPKIYVINWVRVRKVVKALGAI